MTVERAREMLAAVEGVTLADPSTGSGQAGGMPIVAHVPAAQWQAAASLAKTSLGCAFFSFLTAIDWKAEGLEVVAWVENLDARFSVQLRGKPGATVNVWPTLVPVYRGADWMERECFDMFGLAFEGHPDPRRILLADDWEGHPLLKSYAVDTPHPPYR